MRKPQIVIAEPVRDYVCALAPDPRQRCKAALLALPAGDTKQLEGEYAGYHRLRVGSLRFVCRQHEGRIGVFHVEQRRLVYNLLAARIAQLLENG